MDQIAQDLLLLEDENDFTDILTTEMWGSLPPVSRREQAHWTLWLAHHLHVRCRSCNSDSYTTRGSNQHAIRLSCMQCQDVLAKIATSIIDEIRVSAIRTSKTQR